MNIITHSFEDVIDAGGHGIKNNVPKVKNITNRTKKMQIELIKLFYKKKNLIWLKKE